MSKLCIYRGKVRDIYDIDEDFLLMRATNRVSSFNKHLGIVPGKGIMLNNMSKFWFEKTSHIINNHYVSSKGSNMIVKKCTPIKIEFVVRGYIAGNTSTSLWTHYSNGERLYCGIEFPDGLVKNQKLTTPVVTPTTKSDNDEPISKKDIIKQNILTSKECDFIYTKALQLFKYGQEIADKAGFILVDTKYEFGKDAAGKIILIDEIHTPDSSRYFIKDGYQERQDKGLPQKQLSKEFVRQFLISKGFQGIEGQKIPDLNQEWINSVSKRYIELYERMTGIPFLPASSENIPARIQENIEKFISNF